MNRPRRPQMMPPKRRRPEVLEVNHGRDTRPQPARGKKSAPPASPPPSPSHPAAPVAGGGAERDRFVAGMLSRVGGPYCAYPNFRDDCADCSTTISQEYFRATGRTITGSSHAQAALGVSAGRDWHRWEPGDILVYLSGNHTGVYVGDGFAAHAMNEQQGVIKSRVDSDYWLSNFVDARRLAWSGAPNPPKVKPPGGGSAVSDSWKPVVYDIRNDADAERFGLSLAQRDALLRQCISGRNGHAIAAIQLHNQQGYTKNSLQFWLQNGDSSATMMANLDGSLLRVIPEDDGPWTGGDVRSPDARVTRLIAQYGSDPNVYSLTIEAEGMEGLNAEQKRAILWQIRQWQVTSPIVRNAETIVGHYEINRESPEKRRCGTYRDEIVASLAQTPVAVQFDGLPAWLPAEALVAAFPLADPTPGGFVTKRLIAKATEDTRLYWFNEKKEIAPGLSAWRFDQGLTIFSNAKGAWVPGEPVPS